MSIDDKIIKFKKQGKSWHEIAGLLNMTSEQVRSRARRHPSYRDVKKPSNPTEVDDKKYKDDGSIVSYVRKQLSAKKVFTESELLEIHGFNPEEFRIRNVTSNTWTTNTADNEFYNYQSKIIAEPNNKISIVDQITQAIVSNTKPFDLVTYEYYEALNHLIINLPDLHFGINTAFDYSNYQDGILKTIENGYDSIVISLLGDLFHADNFNDKTINETRVDDTDIPNAWEEALLFIDPIIQKAIIRSNKVDVIYLMGNHDASMSWAFSKYLALKYPSINIDTTTEQLKCLQVEGNVLFFTHGHIKRKNICQLCATLFPKQWGESNNRLLFTGHYHNLKTDDLTGLIHYQLPTISADTAFEREQLFLGSQKGLQLFELSDNGLDSVYYLRG